MKINLKSISEQSVVVFGASSGIGRRAAIDFAKRGARVTVAARSESGLASLVAEINSIGGEAIYVAADAADFEQVKLVAAHAQERFGGIDTWVHTAGTMVFAQFERITPIEFKRVIEVNLLGQVYGAMAALPYLRKNGGALIHITSVEAYRTVPFQSAYGASKHGIKGFLQSLRAELRAEGAPVAVAEIMPGVINTPIWEKSRNKFEFKQRPPLPPIYHPRIVSEAILFAAENEVRSMVAGGGALGVPIAERISPRLTDTITSWFGFRQFEDEHQPTDAPDGLFHTVPELDTVEGRFSNEQFMSDPYTWAKTHPRKTKSALLAAVGIAGGFLIYKMANKRGK